MNGTKPKRPNGLTFIAIIGLIFGLVNIYMSFQTIILDIEAFPYLYGPLIAHPWFNTGIIVELILAVFLVILGIIQLITVPGLWTGKPYSYKLALGVPILLLISNVSSSVLYASAPAELGLDTGSSNFYVAMSVFWIIIYFWYLREPHVKAYLGVIQSNTIMQEEKEPEIQQEPISMKEEKSMVKDDKFYCRYCGRENEADAVFCEKCGKKLK
jgi:hypothetical protein